MTSLHSGENTEIITRLDITGDLSINTPECVVNEVCKVYKIKISAINSRSLSLINDRVLKSGVEINTEELEDSTLLKILSFVNPDVKEWNYEGLIKAFNFMISFASRAVKIDASVIKAGFGLQTPDNPYKLNACVLFKICHILGFKTFKDTTMEEMFSMIKMNFEDKKLIKVPESIRRLKKTDLISFVTLFPSICDILISEERNELKEERKELSDQELYDWLFTNYKSDIKLYIKPTSREEFIMLAAKMYKLDLSNVKNLDSLNFHDVDKLEALNGVKSLRTSFNPLFPSCYYLLDDLLTMVNNEGYSLEDSEVNNEDRDDFYYWNVMNNIATLDTFYIIDDPDSYKDRKTCIGMKKITKKCLKYGKNNDFIFFSLSELRAIFKRYESFYNPISKVLFSDLGVSKLAKIASERDLKLLKTINYVYKKMESMEYIVKGYIDKCDVDYVIGFMWKLINASMIIRGWDGESDYPLGLQHVKPIIDIEDNIISYIGNLYNVVLFKEGQNEGQNEGQSRDLEFIIDFPLIKYIPKSEKFVFTKFSDQKTINERVELILEGETTENTHSCIKDSSDIFLSTGWYYLNYLKVKIPFDIKEIQWLERISP